MGESLRRVTAFYGPQMMTQILDARDAISVYDAGMIPYGALCPGLITPRPLSSPSSLA